MSRIEEILADVNRNPNMLVETAPSQSHVVARVEGPAGELVVENTCELDLPKNITDGMGQE